MHIIHTKTYEKALAKLSKNYLLKIEKIETKINLSTSLKGIRYHNIVGFNDYIVILADVSVRIIAGLLGDDVTFYYVGTHEKVFKWLNNNRSDANPTIDYNKIDAVESVTRYAFQDKSILNNDIFNIGILPQGNFFYKYMDLESALLSMQNEDGKSTLRFVEPTSWDDEYEGRFYNADYKKVNGADDTKNPFLYACCMTTKSENEAAWIVYNHNRKGLASHCVEFKINRKKLREQIMKSHQLKGGKVYIGSVSYLGASSIDHIHEPKIDNIDNPLYHEFFDDFNLVNYISLLLLKRNAYKHEEEIRIFIIPEHQESKYQGKRLSHKGEVAKQIFVEIDWIDVIDKVSIDKDCSNYEKKLLQNMIYDLLEKKKDSYSEEEYAKKRERLTLKPFDVYTDNRNVQITIESPIM